MTRSVAKPSLGANLQRFFSERLVAQRNASQQTISSYRDCFRLLLRFAEARLKRSPAELALSDINAELVLAFLDHLEKERQNGIRSRNARLAAVRSFMKYAALENPGCLATSQSVLAIPMKRFVRPLLGFLTREEVDALLAACVRSTWSGRRDYVMFATMYNTGARVSEVVNLRTQDVLLDQAPAVRLHGKGRKERLVPLWKSTTACLRDWLRELRADDGARVFPNRGGNPLSRSGVETRLREVVRQAARSTPSLLSKRVSPHTFRHTTAMHLLQSGVDITVVAMWLGHESPATTHHYVEIDLAQKEKALKKLQDPSVKRTRFSPSDRILAFLDSL